MADLDEKSILPQRHARIGHVGPSRLTLARSALARALRREELFEHAQHRRGLVRGKDARTPGQATLVDGAELVDDDLAVLAREADRHARRRGAARARQRRDDHGAHVAVTLTTGSAWLMRSLLMTSTGRFPACSEPWVGSSAARKTCH